MGSVDWGRLYEQGRCKSIGVAWNEAEKHAAYILNIPADYVRKGCLTKDAYERVVAEEKGEVVKTGKVPLIQLRKEQLYSLCRAKDLNVTIEATKATMIDELKAAGYASSILVSEVPE